MPVTPQRITPFLWFDNQAEEAAGTPRKPPRPPDGRPVL
jgi:hypothetical protein